MSESFISHALGNPHEYDAAFAEELPLLVFVRTGNPGTSITLRCREHVDNPWIDVPHTRSQASQVQSDLWHWQRVHNQRASTWVPSLIA